MAIKLLFSEDSNKKNRRETTSSDGLSREAYEEIEVIRKRVTEAFELTDDHEIPRIKFIKDYPYTTFRVTILKRYREPHTVKRKDGTTVLLQKGLYVTNQMIAEKVSQSEYVFTPPLPEMEGQNVS